MRVQNQYNFYLIKWLKYFEKEEACNYRNQIQKLIDDDNISDFVDVDVVTYDDGRCGICLRGGFMGYIGSKADLYVRYNDADFKLKHILDTIGLSEKIES